MLYSCVRGCKRSIDLIYYTLKAYGIQNSNNYFDINYTDDSYNMNALGLALIFKQNLDFIKYILDIDSHGILITLKEKSKENSVYNIALNVQDTPIYGEILYELVKRYVPINFIHWYFETKAINNKMHGDIYYMIEKLLVTSNLRTSGQVTTEMDQYIDQCEKPLEISKLRIKQLQSLSNQYNSLNKSNKSNKTEKLE